MPLTSEETNTFVRSTDGKKRKSTTEIDFEEIPTNKFHDGSECEPIQLPAFDISMKRMGYGNGKRRVLTMAFEVKCHPDNESILKRLLYRASTSDDKPPNNDNIHFLVYRLPQYTSSELYRTQILKQNSFLRNIAIIPIVNIDPDVMYNDLHYKLVTSSSSSITGIEETRLAYTKGKGLIVTTKKMKHTAQLKIDKIINEGEIPISNENPPGRIVSTNNHQDFITYADMLKRDKKTYNDNMMNPPPPSQKRPISISYELAIVETPKTPKKKNRNEVPPTRKENRSIQSNLMDISESTFLERLEAINTMIKQYHELD